jgi:ribosome modulation factor
MNKALETAFQRGYEDGFKGKSKSSNPYPDIRTEGGQVTFSRAFRNAWQEGWWQGNTARNTNETY